MGNCGRLHTSLHFRITTLLEDGGEEVKEELEANRRGGGYIEKVEFLGRVNDRLEESIDSAKGSKRKR